MRAAAGWTFVGTVFAFFVETPVGGGITVWSGIGQAYTSLENCQRRVVRVSRDCMGYPR